jgi:hypothetical protein
MYSTLVTKTHRITPLGLVGWVGPLRVGGQNDKKYNTRYFGSLNILQARLGARCSNTANLQCNRGSAVGPPYSWGVRWNPGYRKAETAVVRKPEMTRVARRVCTSAYSCNLAIPCNTAVYLIKAIEVAHSLLYNNGSPTLVLEYGMPRRVEVTMGKAHLTSVRRHA